MPRVKVKRPPPVDDEPVEQVADHPDQPESDPQFGTGPERFAPWWLLFEQVITVECPQGPSDILSLTDENLEYLNHCARERFDCVGDSVLSWYSWDGSAPTGNLLGHDDPGYALRLQENGVLPPSDSTRPSNWRALDRMIGREARGLQYPSKEDYKAWLRGWSAIPSPNNVPRDLPPVFNMFALDERYQTVVYEDEEFFRVSHGCGASFNSGLRAPCPNFVQGIDMAGFGHVRVEFIPGAVLFESECEAASLSSITLAHIAGAFFRPSSVEGAAVKAVKIAEKIAEARSSHAGAALVYARNNALRHLRRPAEEGHSHVLTFVTDGGKITFYAHHATEAKRADGSKKVRYHQYPIVTTDMRAGYAEFRRGWAQLRNCQQYAYERSVGLRRSLERQHNRLGAASWTYGRRSGSPRTSQILNAHSRTRRSRVDDSKGSGKRAQRKAMPERKAKARRKSNRSQQDAANKPKRCWRH